MPTPHPPSVLTVYILFLSSALLFFFNNLSVQISKVVGYAQNQKCPCLAGMLPVISTRRLTNFELTLSHDGTRVGNHRCSNLLDHTEVTTAHSFITASTGSPESMGDPAPYQFSSSLRGNSTLRFYRNLNLEACLWEFTSYYHMSELLTDCGGTIGTDGQVRVCLLVYLSPQCINSNRGFACTSVWLFSFVSVCAHLYACLPVCSVYLQPCEWGGHPDSMAPELFACILCLICCLCVCVFASFIHKHLIDRFSVKVNPHK